MAALVPAATMFHCYARRAASILEKQLAGSVSLENSSVKMVEMRDS